MRRIRYLPIQFYLGIIGLGFIGFAASIRGASLGTGAFTWLTRPLMVGSGLSVWALALSRRREMWALSASMIVGTAVSRQAEVVERAVRHGPSLPVMVTASVWLIIPGLAHIAWHHLKNWADR